MPSKIIFMLLVLQSVLFCLFAGCSKTQLQTVPNGSLNNNDSTSTDTTMTDTTSMDTMPHVGDYTWLALGDSYTIGQSVSETERFPAQTAALLKSDSLFFTAPDYIATTGWTTVNLLDAIAMQNPQGPFDIVTLLIGVNDQYQHLDINSYNANFTACLQKAITLAGNRKDHVFVLSIPDYSVTPFAQQSDTAQIHKEIDNYNAINKAITLSYKISYTDITPGTRDMKIDPSLIAYDGLHPAGKEYAKWAAQLAPAIAKALK
jgi:lysophospholipase L1-like esterase